MPDAPATQLQTAIYNTLTNDSALSALITGVFNHVPEGQALPYVVIQINEHTDRSNLETKQAEIVLQIIAYTQERGDKSLLEISQNIYDLLHEVSLTLSSGQTVILNHQKTMHKQLSDGLTRSHHLQFQTMLRV